MDGKGFESKAKHVGAGRKHTRHGAETKKDRRDKAWELDSEFSWMSIRRFL